MGEPLRLSVPTQGVHFSFEKLYANQSPRPAGFSMGYTSMEGNRLGLAASLLGVVVLWIAIVAIGGYHERVPRAAAVALLVVGVASVVAAIGYMGTDPAPAAALALVVAAAIGIWLGARRYAGRRTAGTD